MNTPGKLSVSSSSPVQIYLHTYREESYTPFRKLACTEHGIRHGRSCFNALETEHVWREVDWCAEDT
ncbi:uncharacterized [Tachysurus ichikawai]